MHTRRGGWWWLILVGCGEFGGFGEFVVFGGTHTHTQTEIKSETEQMWKGASCRVHTRSVGRAEGAAV